MTTFLKQIMFVAIVSVSAFCGAQSVMSLAPASFRVASAAYDTKVAGIVSGAGGIAPGLSLSQQGEIREGLPLAVAVSQLPENR